MFLCHSASKAKNNFGMPKGTIISIIDIYSSTLLKNQITGRKWGKKAAKTLHYRAAQSFGRQGGIQALLQKSPLVPL